MKNTKIAWTTHTFNPWIGCAKVSPGCLNCYAERETFARVKRSQGVELWGAQAERHRTSEQYWKQPLKWNEEVQSTGLGARVFCGSLMDWLDERVDPQWLADLMQVIALTPDLTWLMLTKRPELWRARMEACLGFCKFQGNMHMVEDWIDGRFGLSSAFPKNVWFGVTAENQEMLDGRLETLMDVPIYMDQFFVSAEPLLGPLDFNLMGDTIRPRWVIVGGESGRDARPCCLNWIEGVVWQCREMHVPCFVKQLGPMPYSAPGPTTYRLDDLNGRDMSEWPEHLRVQELPTF